VVEMVNFKELDFDGVVSTLYYEIDFCNENIRLAKTSNARTFFVERALMLADIVYNIRKMSILGDDLDEVSPVVEVAEVADSYIVYTVESYQTIKSESFNEKSHAIDQAKKWVLENPKQYVYISCYRLKDGQDFFLNPNGNAELLGKSWGEN
jgi:small-conductance mechanosensitive channel